jgi:short-subunit dehydrogenase
MVTAAGSRESGVGSRAQEGSGRTALVTGASSGIGRAFAELLASRGYAVVLTARRRDRLEAVAAALSATYRVPTHVIVEDLSEPEAPARLVEALRARGLHVDLLVNNAGYGVTGRFEKSEWTTHQDFIQVMVTSVCELTYRLLPAMIERRFGHIINIASLAALLPAPAGHTLYAASKAFLVRFSEALAAENAARGIHATAVCPGFTYTEFHDVTGTREAVNTMPKFMWLDAASVAREGYAAAMQGRAVVVTGRLNRTLAWLIRVMPQALVRRVAGGTGRRYRRT